MDVFLGAIVLGWVGFFIHLWAGKEYKSSALRISELFLLYQLVFSVGLTSLMAFYGLIFMTEYVAEFSGWPNSPFAKLLGNVNLAFATLGFLCIWYRGYFWLATIIGTSVWLLGDAIVHIVDMVQNKNYAPGNSGATFYTDIFIPVVLLIGYAFYSYYSREQYPSLWSYFKIKTKGK